MDPHLTNISAILNKGYVLVIIVITCTIYINNAAQAAEAIYNKLYIKNLNNYFDIICASHIWCLIMLNV